MVSSPLGSCIIVGGGPAGIAVAKGLKKKAIDVTVIDRQNYLDWSLASPRSLVAPDDIAKFGYTMPLEKVCEFVGAKFVQGAVKEIGAKSVTLQDGTILASDCVVVAIGGQYANGAIWKPLPEHTTAELRVAAFRQEHEKVSKANSVVIAGASFAGAEVAGEIKSAFPGKTVTLVGTFLPAARDPKRAKVRASLEKMGVVLKEGRVEASEPNSDNTVTTTKGETLDADLILNAAGFVFDGASLIDSSLKQDVTERGQLLCKPTLQLKSCDTVFGAGDIVAVPENCYADVKGTMHAELTAAIVASNVIALLSQKPLKNFNWSHKPIQSPCFTALGPNIGIGDMGLPGFMNNVGNVMCRRFKCKDYYMSMKGASFGKGKTWK